MPSGGRNGCDLPDASRLVRRKPLHAAPDFLHQRQRARCGQCAGALRDSDPAFRAGEWEVEHYQRAGLDLVVKLMGGDGREHVALQQQTAEQRQVAGLDGRLWRRLAFVMKEAFQQLS